MSAVSAWLQRFAGLIAPGEVLDLACGEGRHAHHLASLGHTVLALDRDGAALRLAAGPGIQTMQFDLEAEGSAWPFAPARFAGIVVTNYLHRPLMAPLLASLKRDGVLLYETFACGNEAFGKPSNPAFLLQSGELLDLAKAGRLRVLAYEEGVISAPKAAMVQRLCALGPDFDLAKARLSPF